MENVFLPVLLEHFCHFLQNKEKIKKEKAAAKAESKQEKRAVKEQSRHEKAASKELEKQEKQQRKAEDNKRRHTDIKWDRLDNTAHLFPSLSSLYFVVLAFFLLYS